MEVRLKEADIVRLTDHATDVHVKMASTGTKKIPMKKYPRKDTIMISLARLDWNGERILERAMTSFRLTLTKHLLPELIREVMATLASEPEHHKVQLLAQRLLEKHMIKLFGMNAGSLVFVLEHCSVEDASLTLRSRERQEGIKQLVLSFLPGWVARSMTAEFRADVYTLTPGDFAQDFGFIKLTTVSFVARVSEAEEEAPSACSRSIAEDEVLEAREMPSPSPPTAYGQDSSSGRGGKPKRQRGWADNMRREREREKERDRPTKGCNIM
ncbi:uncharacterized protein LOC143297753 isoform X2 [Babylonia areolata]|uniref:uncharacterized protein LOC143297753 isoform X2 n=1 Tax=Babylonia areolata TaxID=304850 RepID=UPI003FD295CD